jgi:bifunctional DNase/RNase
MDVFIDMKVSGLTIDPITNTPIVILKDESEQKVLPIWIGVFEASAIAAVLESISFARPMTHDLMNEMLRVLEVSVTKIEIHDLRNNTFFAYVYLEKEGSVIKVDARPSDAIALALRSASNILVDEKVIEKSRNVSMDKKLTDPDNLQEEQTKEFLENLSPEDFGKYKM